MNDFVIIQISAPIYGGFRYSIPKYFIETMTQDEIIKEVKIFMKNFFEIHNLFILKEGVDKLELHFHEEIDKNKDVIYLCNHK